MSQKKDSTSKSTQKSVNRRDFLRVAGLTGAGSLLAACTPQATPTQAPPPTQPAAPPPTQPPAATQPQAVATEPPVVTEAPVVVTEAPMPFKGTKIKVLLSDFSFSQFLDKIKGEFTEKTGIEVEVEIVSFNVILDQAEIELSSGSSNYDVMWQVFIKAQRWMQAGWSTVLDDYIAKSGYDMSDFIQSTIDAMTWEGKVYGIPFLAESTQMILRNDVLKEKGLVVPQTFDEMETVLAAIHNPPDFHAYVMRTEPNGVHFPFPIWLQGYGGNIFRDPPRDLTPLLNTPEALAATTDFTDKIMKYSIAGSQIYNTPDCQNAMAQGLSGCWVDALSLFAQIYNPETSKVADKVLVVLPPGGPAGRFPQIATHGLQIPAGSKKKDAAWEFISWACSKEIMERSTREAGYAAVNRISILTSDEYAELFNKGESEMGKLTIEALNMSNCAYRQVPQFPEIGRRVGQAIGEIISKQKTVKEAMDAAQADAETVMKNAGIPISP